MVSIFWKALNITLQPFLRLVELIITNILLTFLLIIQQLFVFGKQKNKTHTNLPTAGRLSLMGKQLKNTNCFISSHLTYTITKAG